MERIQKGTVVGGWRLLEPLGRGGMGVVFLAEDGEGRRAALKLLTLADPRARLRFEREAQIGRQLRHPNVVRTLDAGELGGQPYLVMEFVEGRDLAAITRDKGRLAPGAVLELAQQLAAGLEELHRRELVHRDLKPENLMIDRAGVLKIMDLGLIRDPDAATLTKTGSLVGTPWFMAPEQVTGARATPATDLFAFALLLYCLLTGRHPFRRADEKDFLDYLRRLTAASPRPWHPRGAGGPLDMFFARGLARDPAARFRSARQLAEAFERALTDQAQGTHRSVEDTLELEVEDSGVGAFEDLELPEERGAPTRGPGGPEPAARSPVPPASGSGSLPAAQAPTPVGGVRRVVVLALVLGLPLFLLSIMWEGFGREEVLVTSVEGLHLASGRVLLVRTEQAADLGTGGVSARLRAEGGRLHLLDVPDGAASVEVRTRRGTPVYGEAVGAIEWREPPVAERSFDEFGSLVMVYPRPPHGALSMRRPGGGAIADSSSDPGTQRFRVADPAGAGVGPLELVLKLGDEDLLWRELPRQLSEAACLERLMGALEGLDAVAWMREAGRGEGAPARLRARLEEAGLIELLRLVRSRVVRLVARREAADPSRDRWLLQLHELAALDAYFASAGHDPPFGLLSGDHPGAVWSQGYYEDRPEALGPGSHIFARYADYFALTDSPSILIDKDPTALFVRGFEEQELSPMEDLAGDHWLALYSNEWRAGFFAEVRLNDGARFLVADDPRVDRPAGWDAAVYRTGNPERRIVRVRVPASVLVEQNRVRIDFRPWAHREAEDVVRPFAILQALALEPVR